MAKLRTVLAALPMLALLGLAPLASAGAAETGPLAKRLTELAPPPAAEALERIPDLGRKLLALRSYVRVGSGLADRWSWTEEQITAFQGSPAQDALLAEVAAVGAHFARENPGYEIYANTRVRSLDTQIRNWNRNKSVGVAAREILTAWRERFGDEAEAAGPDALRRWLSGFRSTERANLAAPGLTAHGRAHAIDFQIMKDGQIIAGADSRQIETVWREQGWEEKLKESMDAAGPSFSGPLRSPNEPWHYNYDPSARVAADESGAD